MKNSGDRFQLPASVEDLRGFNKNTSTEPAVPGAPLVKHGDNDWRVASSTVNYFESTAVSAVTKYKGVVISGGGVSHRTAGGAGDDTRSFIGIALSDAATNAQVTILQVGAVPEEAYTAPPKSTIYMTKIGEMTSISADGEGFAIGYSDAEGKIHLHMAGAGGGGGTGGGGGGGGGGGAGEINVAEAGIPIGPADTINFNGANVKIDKKQANITYVIESSGGPQYPVGFSDAFPWTSRVIVSDAGIWLRQDGGLVDLVQYPMLKQSLNILDIVSDVPLLTKNSQPPWTASASSVNTQYAAYTQAYRPFSGDPNVAWASKEGTINVTTGVLNQWLQIANTTPFRIHGYSIQGEYERYSPPFESWKLLGSNNGTTWVTLDEQDKYPYPLGYNTENFVIDATTEYSFYRLNITKCVLGLGPDSYVSVRAMSVWGNLVRITAVPKDGRGWYTYVKVQDGPRVPSTSRLNVLSDGVSKGYASSLDFKKSKVFVDGVTASITIDGGGGGGEGGGTTCVPIGFVSPQPWNEDVVTSDGETWVRLDGSPVKGGDYPDIADNRNVFIPVALTPVFKGPTSGTFTTSASSQTSATYLPWKAFDGIVLVTNYWSSVATAVDTANGNVISSEWLRISNATPFEITGYGVAPTNTNPISAWIFEGSSDGTTWVELDAQGDITLQSAKLSYFTLRDQARYAHYRIRPIVCKITNTAVKYISISELVLVGSDFTLADLQPDSNGWWYYVKASHVPGSGGGGATGDGTKIIVAEVGVNKGTAEIVNFSGANVSMDKSEGKDRANVKYVIHSQGGNGYPVGFTGYYPWTDRVVISDAGVWIRQDGGLVDLTQYPQLKSSASLLEINTDIPIMTANATAPWTASASSVYGPTYPAWAAFDGIHTLENTWVSAAGTADLTTGNVPNSWLQISKNVALTIHGYGFMGNLTQYYNPIKSWKFMGSTNASTWVTLDTQMEYGYPISDSMEYFTLAAPATYRFFRLQILALQTGVSGYSDCTSIGEMILWGGNVRIKPIPRDANGYFQYVKIQSGPFEGGGTTPLSEIEVSAAGVTKGKVSKLNFQDQDVVVVGTEATIIGGGGSGGGGTGGGGTGGGIPLGYVSTQAWDEITHVDESGTWLRLDGSVHSFAKYPGLAAGAQYLQTTPCVPQMTANTTGAFTAAASSFSAPFLAWTSFASGSGGWHSAQNSFNSVTGVGNQWVQVTKTTPFKIYGYSFAGASSAYYNGLWSWSFMASNDNVKWDTLDTHAHYEPCVQDRHVFFYVNVPTLYKTYRINVTKNKPNTLGYDSGNNTLCSVPEFNLFDAPVTLPAYGGGAYGWPLYIKAAHAVPGGG